MSIIQRRVFVSGQVQGVFFRASLVQQVHATDALVRGTVKNLPDGRVEAVICGASASVLLLVAWCGRGPARAVVTELEVIEEEVDQELPLFCQREAP